MVGTAKTRRRITTIGACTTIRTPNALDCHADAHRTMGNRRCEPAFDTGCGHRGMHGFARGAAMILDMGDLENGAELAARIVVIGTGIAGAEVALRLARRGHDVLVLESGRRAFDPAIQALNDLTFAGKRHRRLDPEAGYHAYLPEGLRGVSRVRQFGGTSTVWTGKWKLFQPGDFEGRPWVPQSAWPIGYDALIDHYRGAARDYGLQDLEAEARRAEIGSLRGAIAPSGLKLSSFYWEASPTRTADRFSCEMDRRPTLRVVLGATATELLVDEAGHRVVGVACRSLSRRSLTVRAGTVVLAAGGLETPRLLLASDRQIPGGIGNAKGLVGRYYSGTTAVCCIRDR